MADDSSDRTRAGAGDDDVPTRPPLAAIPGPPRETAEPQATRPPRETTEPRAAPSRETSEPQASARGPSPETIRRARALAAAEAARRRRGGDTTDPRRPPANATVHRSARRHLGLDLDVQDAPANRRLGPRLLAFLAMAVVIAGAAVLINTSGSSATHRTRTTPSAQAHPTSIPHRTDPHAKTKTSPAGAKHTASSVTKPHGDATTARSGSTRTQTKPSPTGKTTTWPTYTTAAYTVSYPPGWTVAERDVPVSGGAYDETRFVAPGGATEIDVDRTPTDPDTPHEAATSVSAVVGTESGYHELSFTALTLAGAAAWRWTFDAPAGGRIGVSGYHDDIFRRIAGGRYATLGVGGRPQVTGRLTERVAASLRAR